MVDQATRDKRAIKACLWFGGLLTFGNISFLILIMSILDNGHTFHMDRVFAMSIALNLISTLYIAYRWYTGMRDIHKEGED